MESGNTPGSFNRLVEDDVAAIVLAHDLDDWIDGLYGFVGVLHLHGKIDHAVVGSEPAGIDDLQLGGFAASCSAVAASACSSTAA